MSDRKTKIQALVACQIPNCAEEVSYPLDMVAMWEGKPICEECFRESDFQTYDEAADEFTPAWSDLPPVTLKDLSE